MTRIVLSLALGFALVGCGGDAKKDDAAKSVITGKLTENGKPFVFDQTRVKLPPGATAMPPGMTSDSLLAITFTPADGGEMVTAKTNPQAGTFELLGTDSKGIKPGRYRVTVTGSYGPGTPDAFEGRFAPGKTKLIVDVKAGEEVTIDVGKSKS